ncbi:MAG TPA: CAP domain-containing protein, partial [Pseudomonadales bacterium]|nr:CAP domain-containing protein [Pseudomonadales bacterium]
QQHAERMALEGYFDHVDAKGRGVGERLLDAGFKFHWAGENISAGKSDARAVFEWWMSSETHRQNILKAEFRVTGFGYFYIAQDRHHFHHYWVEVFASGH